MENNEIPSAESFRIKAWNYALENTPHEKTNVWIDKAMRDFAALHVSKALEMAAENAKVKYIAVTTSNRVLPMPDKESILNCYPKELIK